MLVAAWVRARVGCWLLRVLARARACWLLRAWVRACVPSVFANCVDLNIPASENISPEGATSVRTCNGRAETLHLAGEAHAVAA